MSRWVEVMERHRDSPIRVKPSERRRTMKRREAEHRNDATPPMRTAAYRRSLDADQLYTYRVNQHVVYMLDCPLGYCPYLGGSNA